MSLWRAFLRFLGYRVSESAPFLIAAQRQRSARFTSWAEFAQANSTYTGPAPQILVLSEPPAWGDFTWEDAA